MSIHLRCPCGFSAQVEDKFAGKRTICPKCSAKVVVPEPKAGHLDMDDVKLVDESDAAPKPIPKSDPKSPAKAAPKPATPGLLELDNINLLEDRIPLAKPVDKGAGPKSSAKPTPQPAPPSAKASRTAAKPARPQKPDPDVEDDFEIVEDVEVVEEKPARKSTERAAPDKGKPTKPGASRLTPLSARKNKSEDKDVVLELDEADEENDRPRDRARKKDADEEQEKKAKPKKRKRRVRTDDDEPPAPLIAFSAGTAAGFGLLVSGGIWFGVAWSNGFINIRAIAAMVIGLAMLLRGFLGLAEE